MESDCRESMITVSIGNGVNKSVQVNLHSDTKNCINYCKLDLVAVDYLVTLLYEFFWLVDLDNSALALDLV